MTIIIISVILCVRRSRRIGDPVPQQEAEPVEPNPDVDVDMEAIDNLAFVEIELD